MVYRPFDPTTDEDKELYEIQSQEQGDVLATVFVPSKYSYDEAKDMPWHFVVEADDGDLV